MYRLSSFVLSDLIKEYFCVDPYDMRREIKKMRSERHECLAQRNTRNSDSLHHAMLKRNRWQMLFTIDVPRNLVIFTAKRLSWFNMLQT